MTRQKTLTALRWVLYAAVFLAAMMVQTVALPDGIGGFSVACVPVAIACVAMGEGAEGGGAFALAASTLWCLSGAAYGSAQIVLLTCAGVLCGGLCQVALTDRLLPAVLLSFMTLLLNNGVCFALRLYLGGVRAGQAVTCLLPSIGISLCFVPVFYALARLIARIGRGPAA